MVTWLVNICFQVCVTPMPLFFPLNGPRFPHHCARLLSRAPAQGKEDELQTLLSMCYACLHRGFWTLSTDWLPQVWFHLLCSAEDSDLGQVT